MAADQTAFQKIVADPNVQQHVLAAARRSTVMLQNPCSGAEFTLLNDFAIYHPPTFDGAGAMIGGAWKQAVGEKGCGVGRLLNVLAWVPKPKTLGTAPLLPGRTRADPQLQKDAVGFAVIATGGREANCNIGYVADTTFLGQTGAPIAAGKGPPWREVWTLVTCTKKFEVPMQFIPDATGTTIVAGPHNAVKVSPL